MQKVLIVDDEPNVLNALQRVFRQSRIQADTFESARDALEILKDEHYDCIISDYRMPEIDGLEFLELASELSSHAPRVLLSGHADFHVLEKAINNCKIECYLAKPWSNDHLTAVVTDLITESQAKLKLQQEHKDALVDLARAAKFQKDNLPHKIRDPRLHTGYIFAPLSTLSGDLISYHMDNGDFNYCVIDAAGYGTVAAMEAYAVQMLVNYKQYKDPSEFIDSVNQRYAEGEGSRLFTLTSGHISFAEDKLYLCQAGHPNSYLIRNTGINIVERLGKGGLPIGYTKDAEHELYTYDLLPNDIILTFSENFTEECTSSLEQLLASLPPMEIRELEAVLETWLKSVSQTDDISAVLMIYKPAE